MMTHPLLALMGAKAGSTAPHFSIGASHDAASEAGTHK